jgi:HEPN domain-containing protein
MNDGPRTQAQILLIKAAEDEVALHVEGNPESIFGFHAQQAVEKLIKALLSAHAVPFELTHNLGRLEIALQAAGENLPTTPLSLSELNDFAVLYRYDLLFQFAVPDRAAAIETVRLIREYVVERIAALPGVGVQPPVQ